MNAKRSFLCTLIGSVSISALIGIFVLVVGGFGELEVRVLLTTLTVTATSILGLACGAYLETGRGRTLPMVGIVFTIIAALSTFLIIWDLLDDSEFFVKSAGSLMVLAVALSHMSLLSIARLDAKFIWSRYLAFAAIASLAALILAIIWTERFTDSDLVPRTMGVLAIVIAAMTVITPIFHKLSSGDGSDAGEIAAIDREIGDLRARLETLERRRAEIISESCGPED